MTLMKFTFSGKMHWTIIVIYQVMMEAMEKNNKVGKEIETVGWVPFYLGLSKVGLERRGREDASHAVIEGRARRGGKSENENSEAGAPRPQLGWNRDY